MGMQRVTSWFKATYDRLIAVIIMTVLIVSLLYLAVRIGMVKAQQATWEVEIVNLVPAHPEADSVQSDAFDGAMAQLENPHIVPHGTWGRRFVVPEERFSCEHCKYPNEMQATNCVSCEEVLDDGKVDPDFDEDLDGIPNVAEEEFGLDPLDPDDAALDKDGDGFSNLLEYENETDLNDKNSTPPIEAWIKLESIEAEAFNLLFKAYSTLPDGSLMFQLNTKDGGKTHFKKMGDEVEGFTLVKFETNFVEEVKYKMKMSVDKSKLSLKFGERVIVLVKLQNVKWDKFNATLIYERDGRRFMVHNEDKFELQGKKYKVNRIDTSSRTVVIIRISDSREFKIVSGKSAGPVTAPEVSGEKAVGEKPKE